MARLSDAFIDDRAPATDVCDAVRRAAARGSTWHARGTAPIGGFPGSTVLMQVR